MSVLIKIVLFGIGNIEGEIIRHISPLTADAIINKLPFVLRGRYSFGSKNYHIEQIKCKGAPVCAVVAAVYKIESW